MQNVKVVFRQVALFSTHRLYGLTIGSALIFIAPRMTQDDGTDAKSLKFSGASVMHIAGSGAEVFVDVSGAIKQVGTGRFRDDRSARK